MTRRASDPATPAPGITTGAAGVAASGVTASAAPPVPPVPAKGLLRRFHAAHLHDYNVGATIYWTVMVGIGAILIISAVADLAQLDVVALVQVAVGVACATLAGLVPIRVPRSKTSFAVGEIFIFLLLLLHGVPAAVLAATVEAAVATQRTSKRWSSRIVGPALAAVSLTLAGTLFERLQALAASAGLTGPGVMLSTLLLVAVVAAVCNVALQTTVFVLKSGRSLPLSDWLASFGWIGIVNAASAAVSGLLFVSFKELGPAVLLIAVPIIAGLLAALHLYFRVVDLDEQNRAARVEAMEREAAQAARHVAELQRSEQRFHSAFSHASIGMALVGTDGRVLQSNAALSALLACPPEQITGHPITNHVTRDEAWPLTEHMAEVREGRVNSFTTEVRCPRTAGDEVHVALNGSVFADDAAGQPCLILQMQDVTARLRAEQRLQHIAYHDGLTDLANRGRFLTELSDALALHRNDPARRCAVLFLDFDRFKLINDSLGHNVGDEFLRVVAARLRANVRPGDLVARLGGDEFAILLRPIDDDLHPVRLAERLQRVLREPMMTAGHELHTSASIGIRVSDDLTATPQDMLRDADTAMYRAKAAGKARHCVFDAGMHAQVSEQLRLEQELRQAFERDELGVVLQPIVALDTGTVLAFEALVRWQHPRLGPLEPRSFIALAEESGQMTQLTQRVLERACAALQHVAAATGITTQLAVNVSALDLCQRGFASRVASVLMQYGMTPQQLSLELTEGMLMERLDAALETLGDLRDLGVGLCIDDFGTGYSSLSHLSSLPIHALKIDERFVRHLGREAGSAEIVGAVVQLGASLGKAVVAEGVETTAQLLLLRELGCHGGQGFLFGAPQPATAWRERLKARSGALMLPLPAGVPIGTPLLQNS